MAQVAAVTEQDAVAGPGTPAGQGPGRGAGDPAPVPVSAPVPAPVSAPESRRGDWWRHPVESVLDLPRPSRATVHRRVVQVLLAAYLLSCVVCGSLVVTAAVDDLAISRDRGTATAEVLSTGAKTLVRFPDDEGRYHSPGTGLKYPGGLTVGDRVKVEYRRSDPDDVKVAGRTWTLAFLPAVSSWVVCTAVAAAAGVGVRWWFRRWPEDDSPTAGH